MTLTIPNELFFTEILHSIEEGKKVRINAKGNSMLPLIRDGKDVIVLERLSATSISPGNIVLAILPDGNYVLHRIEKIESSTCILRGDGNTHKFEYCKKESILAEATAVIRNGKTIEKNSFIWKMVKICFPKHPFLRRLFLAIFRRISK